MIVVAVRELLKINTDRAPTGEKNRLDGSCNTNGRVTLSGAPLLANLIMARRYIVARRSYHSCSRCVRSHPAADTWSVLRAGVAGTNTVCSRYLIQDLRHRDILAVSFFRSPSQRVIYLYHAYARIVPRISLNRFRYLDRFRSFTRY